MPTFLEFLTILNGFNIDRKRTRMIDDTCICDYDENQLEEGRIDVKAKNRRTVTVLPVKRSWFSLL